jgi:anti-sigma factor RsiW
VRGWLDRHVDDTTLRLLALDPGALAGPSASHLRECPRCQARAARAVRQVDAARAEAHAEADVAFPDTDLERQRRSILARIARGHRSARVLPFPGHEPVAAPQRADRRWLAAAAAAGLVLGALAGQLPHLNAPESASVGIAVPAVVATRADVRPLEDTLLSEVEEALDAGARPELRALDGLTPVHYEIR